MRLGGGLDREMRLNQRIREIPFHHSRRIAGHHHPILNVLREDRSSRDDRTGSNLRLRQDDAPSADQAPQSHLNLTSKYSAGPNRDKVFDLAVMSNARGTIDHDLRANSAR